MCNLSSARLSTDIYLSEFQEHIKDYNGHYHFCSDILDAFHNVFPSEGLERVIEEGGKTLRLQAIKLETSDIMVTFRDITSQIAYEKILSDRASAVKQLSQIREMLFRQVSYQLREPMTAISGFSEVLESEIFGTLNEKQKEYISDMRQASDQMLELIDNLRDLVSLTDDAKDFQKDFRENSLIQILESASQNVHNQAKEKQLHIHLDIQSEDISLLCDYTSLRQAIMQLLYNAIDASPYDNNIHLSLVIDQSNVTISVKDNGAGLDQDALRIIEEGHHSDQMKGYGLLYVRRVCELHNAKLYYVSGKDVGTEIQITLAVN